MLLQCTPLLTRALFVCVPAFTHRLQYQSAPAPPILPSLALWITGVTRGTFICLALSCVFNMCPNCWTVRSGSELRCPTISLCSTRTSFSAQWKDVGVFTISALGYLRGKIWGVSQYIYIPALPAPHILSLVGAFSPNLILLPLFFFIWTTFLSHIPSNQCQVFCKSFLGAGGKVII